MRKIVNIAATISAVSLFNTADAELPAHFIEDDPFQPVNGVDDYGAESVLLITQSSKFALPNYGQFDAKRNTFRSVSNLPFLDDNLCR